MKSFLRQLIGLFAPILLIAGGAGLIGLGLTYAFEALVWTGLVLIVVGIVWGVFVYFIADSISWFD